ncbi:hypothetical protein ACFU8W_47530 [Streptomyces sp. NPDC057565]|uniref:hypothetical protein n=1 Tax=Streptomyces sp. NPDC057565 TaxID=3346169 RepID=UPI00368679BA
MALSATVRFDPGESLEIGRWILELRNQTGIRWDKAEVTRELLRSLVQPLDLKILERSDAVSNGNPPHRWWQSAF